jgi:hypothetical protein
MVTMSGPGVRMIRASDFKGVIASDNCGQFIQLPWNEVAVHLLRMLGLQPGDRLMVKRCDGPMEALSLDVLNERCADEIHNT